MNTLPFISTNGLWKLDMPALMDPIMPSTNQLILIEAGIVTILDTLSANLFTSLTLEFHYQSIHPYDALLIKEGVLDITLKVYHHYGTKFTTRRELLMVV